MPWKFRLLYIYLWLSLGSLPKIFYFWVVIYQPVCIHPCPLSSELFLIWIFYIFYPLCVTLILFHHILPSESNLPTSPYPCPVNCFRLGWIALDYPRRLQDYKNTLVDDKKQINVNIMVTIKITCIWLFRFWANNFAEILRVMVLIANILREFCGEAEFGFQGIFALKSCFYFFSSRSSPS